MINNQKPGTASSTISRAIERDKSNNKAENGKKSEAVAAGADGQNVSFNRNSRLAMANNYANTGIRMVNRPTFGLALEAARTNKIHFFKFD